MADRNNWNRKTIEEFRSKGARSVEYGKAGPCFCSQPSVPGVANTTPHPPCTCAMVTACSSSPLKLAHPLTPTGTITCSPTLKSPSRSGPKPTKPLPRLSPVKSETGSMPNKRNCILSSPIIRGRRPGRSQWSHWTAKKTNRSILLLAAVAVVC